MALRGPVKVSGWAFGEVLTSAQMTAVDILAGESIEGNSGTYGIEQLTAVNILSPHPPIPNDPTQWTGFAPTGVGCSVNTAEVLRWGLHVPNGCTITGWTFRLSGGIGHSALPADMPHVTLKRIDLSDIATSIGSQVTDTSATVGAYQAAHSISLSSLSEVVDTSTRRYFLQLTTESGANATSGTRPLGCYVTVTIDKLDPRG